MQIHELSRRRQVDEGFMDIAKGIGNRVVGVTKAAGSALGAATGITAPSAQAASAGILDPAKKLDAVRKNKDMQRVAAQWAKEWMKKQSTPVPEALSVKDFMAAAPPAMQQQLQQRLAKQQGLEKQTGRPNPYMTTAAQLPVTTAPAKTTGTSMPLTPRQIPGAGTTPTPTNPTGYTAVTPPSNPATAKYLKDFLEFANEKIAMRDPTTYKMIGLTAVEQSKMEPLLDAAKQQVIAAQAKGDSTGTELAVKDYILTAMAGAQLAASENARAAAKPQAPAYGQQATPPVSAGQPGAAATAPATGQLSGANAVSLLTKSGLTAQLLGSAGQAIRRATGNRQLSSTGDSAIDTMLEGMGYTVS